MYQSRPCGAREKTLCEWEYDDVSQLDSAEVLN